jgi:hypothetical protein
MTIAGDDHRRNFYEACAAADAGNLNRAFEFFNDDEDAAASLELVHTDHVEFHHDGGLPWTSLRREYALRHRGNIVIEWWEEYNGFFGSMGAGWWIEEQDASGPPEGLTQILDALGLDLPAVDVPRPTVADDNE